MLALYFYLKGVAKTPFLIQLVETPLNVLHWKFYFLWLVYKCLVWNIAASENWEQKYVTVSWQFDKKNSEHFWLAIFDGYKNVGLFFFPLWLKVWWICICCIFTDPRITFEFGWIIKKHIKQIAHLFDFLMAMIAFYLCRSLAKE